MKIGLVPTTDELRQNRLLNLNDYDIESNPWVRLIEDKGYFLSTIDSFDLRKLKPDVIIFLGLDWLVMYYAFKYNIPSIYIAAESPVIEINHRTNELTKLINYFSIIHTWNDSLYTTFTDNFRSFYYSFRKDTPLTFSDKTHLINRELLCHVSSRISSKSDEDLYQYRMDLNFFMTSYLGDRFHFYGKGWITDSNNYKGYTGDKFSVISKYKFTLVIENCITENGYVSEKILDAFQARTVPVYLGAKNIAELVDSSTFIDIRKFIDFRELADYLVSLNDEDYFAFLEQADMFLKSNHAIKFTKSSFIQNINSSILEASRVVFNKQLRMSEIYRLYTRAGITKIKRIIKCTLRYLGLNQFGCYKQ
jgi:hypothetical protein